MGIRDRADADALKVNTEALAGTIRHALLLTRNDEHRWTALKNYGIAVGCIVIKELLDLFNSL
jgi:hypothetical protein